MKITARHLEIASGVVLFGGVAALIFGFPSASGPAALLQRPVKPSNRMTAAETREVVRVAQVQLKALGYPITRVDGIAGPETLAAVNAFADQHNTEITIIAGMVGQANYDNAVSIAIDDAYRARMHLPQPTILM